MKPSGTARPVYEARVNAAVDTLATYNKDPFITGLLKQPPKKPKIPLKYAKDELCDFIRKTLLGQPTGKKKYVLTLEELINHLDFLQETGRQHVYLFHLPDEDRDQLLARLRDLDGVKSVLGGEEQLYCGGQLIWEAKDGPRLALVRLDPADGAKKTPRRLVLKWVETRNFWVPLNTGGQPAALGVKQTAQIMVQREERATTFFVMNLDNGECELRIQALHTRARKARQKQLAAYRLLVAQLFGVEPVGPTVLAPAIRQLLLTHEFPMVHCTAFLPDGGRFEGGKNEYPPAPVDKLQAGLTLRFELKQPEGGIGRVELDGHLDEILVLSPLLAECNQMLLGNVRNWAHEGIELKPWYPEPTTWAAILQAALQGTQLEPPVEHQGIIGAIREYARTHAGEKAANATRSESDVKSLSAGLLRVASGDDRQRKQFLSYIKLVQKNDSAIYQREIASIRKEEQWTFRLRVAAEIMALTAVAIFAFLVFFTSKPVVGGTITALLGALTGRGTVLIHSHEKQIKAKRELIENRLRYSQNILTSLHTTLVIPNALVREKAMERVISTLIGSVPVGKLAA